VSPGPRIAPSILSADFASLGDAIDGVRPEADLLHIDVMDGHFVPNLTIGPPVVKAVRRHTDLYLDCHLMMDNPATFLDAFARAGASGCTVHAELDGVGELLEQARALGLEAGLALNPDTPFEVAAPHLEHLDLLLLMTVFPGFAGQRFMAEVLPKVTEARREIDRRGLDLPIEVDGGIDEDTAPLAAAAGASVFVAGSAIFGADDPLEAARRIRAAASVPARA